MGCGASVANHVPQVSSVNLGYKSPTDILLWKTSKLECTSYHPCVGHTLRISRVFATISPQKDEGLVHQDPASGGTKWHLHEHCLEEATGLAAGGAEVESKPSRTVRQEQQNSAEQQRDRPSAWVLAAVQSKHQHPFFACGRDEARAVEAWFRAMHRIFGERVKAARRQLGSVHRIRCISAQQKSFLARVPSKMRVHVSSIVPRDGAGIPRKWLARLLSCLKLPPAATERRLRVTGSFDSATGYSSSEAVVSARSVNLRLDLDQEAAVAHSKLRGASDGAVLGLGLRSCFRKPEHRSPLYRQAERGKSAAVEEQSML